MSLRRIRKWATVKATGILPRVPRLAVEATAAILARLGPHIPILGSLVARNMREAGITSPHAVRTYFRHATLHLANAARMLRENDPRRAAALAESQVAIDGSIDRLRDALREGRGAVLVPPHVCNYVLTLVRLHKEVPLSVYLRWSKDERKRKLKEAWCAAAGLRVILEPASAADPTSRAVACVEVLREGGVLVMTPDIAQKRGRGVAVQLFNREVALPSGPASIAMLAESPLVPVFGRLEDKRHVITFEQPIVVRPRPRAEGGRTAALHEAMQSWAEHFEKWLRAEPAAWFLWADSRWSRVLDNDEEYVR